MIRLSYIIVLNSLLFILSSVSLQAQTVEPKFDQLSITIPNCVLHDSYGFIWIGAQEGLIRYDGYQLKKYTQIPFDSTTLSINWVTAIKEDNIGNLWIGTLGGGLNYFDQKTENLPTSCIVLRGRIPLESILLPALL